MGKGSLAFGAAALVENTHSVVGLSPTILGAATLAALARSRYLSDQAKRDVEAAWQHRYDELRDFRRRHKEPIDVYSTHAGEYPNSVWRWHGLDESIPYAAGQRLRAIADAVEESGLTKKQPIVVSWDKLGERFAESDKIGTIQSAHDTMKSLLGAPFLASTHSVEVVDSQGPDKLAMLSIDEARELADMLETDSNNILEKLVSATNTERIRVAFQEHQQGTRTLTQLRQFLRRELEMLIDDEYTVQADDHGLRERFNAPAHISGDRVDRWTSTASRSVNPPHIGPKSVISFANEHCSIEQLIGAVLSGKDKLARDALIAAYLYTLQDEADAQTAGSRGEAIVTSDYSEMPTTFSRLAERQAAITFRKKKLTSAVCALAFGGVGYHGGTLVTQLAHSSPELGKVSEMQTDALRTLRATLAERSGIDIAFDGVIGRSYPEPEGDSSGGLV